MKTKIRLFIFFVFVFSISLFAENVQAEHASKLFLYSIIVGTVCLTAAAIAGAFAQSKALRTSVDNIGRNPAAADSIRGVLIIALALIESLVIYVLLIDLILYFIKWGKYTF